MRKQYVLAQENKDVKLGDFVDVFEATDIEKKIVKMKITRQSEELKQYKDTFIGFVEYGFSDDGVLLMTTKYPMDISNSTVVLNLNLLKESTVKLDTLLTPNTIQLKFNDIDNIYKLNMFDISWDTDRVEDSLYITVSYFDMSFIKLLRYNIGKRVEFKLNVNNTESRGHSTTTESIDMFGILDSINSKSGFDGSRLILKFNAVK